VFLVSVLVLTNSIAVAATTAVAAVIIWAWFYVPLVTFRR
jgi:hypothetical protein